MKIKTLPPYAPILVESTRSIGYSFETALADIIDNSLSKLSKNINIYFSSLNNPYIAILDDGCGMSSEQLEDAMRYGSQDSLAERSVDDLGRFGLGLKVASLSQCRKLTVATKANNNLSVRCWDLDFIIEKENWALQEYEEDEIANIPHIDLLDEQVSGTLVVWENFDRIGANPANFEKVFNEKIDIAKKHMSLVFHRYINSENKSQSIKIYFNNLKIDAYDPFLLDNPATQNLAEQFIEIEGNRISIIPHILPFVSKLKDKDRKALGEQSGMRPSQGFYVYRNRRLIIWGTWFRLVKQSELHKLARIQVDIPNSLDSLWEIDIKKSTASLPEEIRKKLKAIVLKAVDCSERVTTHKVIENDSSIEQVWKIINKRGSYNYLINREMALFKQLEDGLDDKGQEYLNSFLKLIENSIPFHDIYHRLSKETDKFNVNTVEDEEVYKLGIDMLDSVLARNLDIKPMLAGLHKMDFFKNHLGIVEKLRKDYGHE